MLVWCDQQSHRAVALSPPQEDRAEEGQPWVTGTEFPSLVGLFSLPFVSGRGAWEEMEY